MQIDNEQPPRLSSAPIASTSALPALSNSQAEQPPSAQERDIAHGAIQRERRKREQRKDWQVVKGKETSTLHDDNDYDHENGSEPEHDENDVADSSFVDSLGLRAPLNSLLVSGQRTRILACCLGL